MLINNSKFNYELKKVKSKNDNSLVYLGYSVKGNCTLVNTPYGICVRVDSGRHSDWLHTSPIETWTKTGNKYTINTLNSTYELTEIPNGKKETSKKNGKSKKQTT